MEIAKEAIESASVDSKKEDTAKIEDQKIETQENEDVNEFDSLPEKTKEEIRKLRRESADRRIKTKELQTQLNELKEVKEQYEEDQKKKLEEDGKLKELVDMQSKEIEELKLIKEANAKYEAYFQDKLDQEIKGLGKETTELILSSDKTISDKLEAVRKIKAEINKNTNSPASVRIGNTDGNGNVNLETMLSKIKNESDMKKKTKMIFEVKDKYPGLYEQI
jgi:hypothetical protein